MGYAEKLRALLDWAPILNYLMAISAAPAGKERVYRTLELLDYLATKTDSQIDNELLAKIRACLMTNEGALLLDYLAAQFALILTQPPPPQALYGYHPR